MFFTNFFQSFLKTLRKKITTLILHDIHAEPYDAPLIITRGDYTYAIPFWSLDAPSLYLFIFIYLFIFFFFLGFLLVWSHA